MFKAISLQRINVMFHEFGELITRHIRRNGSRHKKTQYLAVQHPHVFCAVAAASPLMRRTAKASLPNSMMHSLLVIRVGALALANLLRKAEGMSA